jgi:hypothetical protein
MQEAAGPAVVSPLRQRMSQPRSGKGAKGPKKKRKTNSGTKLKKVTAAYVLSTLSGSVEQLVAEVGPEQKTWGAVRCHLLADPSLGYIARKPAEIEAAHDRALDHLLVDGAKATGRSLPQRTCQASAVRVQIALACALGGHKLHTNRAWVSKQMRYFQGLWKAPHGYAPLIEAFRMLSDDELACLAKQFVMMVLEFPEIDPDKGDAPLLFAYSGSANSQSLPHGIAINSSEYPRKWHTEPGGVIYILITCNTKELGSCGYYVTPDALQAGQNYTKRMALTTAQHVHDDRLLKSKLSHYDSNFVCAACDSLPIVWGGKMLTDPKMICGQGATNNKYFKVKQFRLRPGSRDLEPDDFWPHNIKPPKSVRDFLELHDIKVQNTFIWEAYANPTGFLCLFPTFRVYVN